MPVFFNHGVLFDTITLRAGSLVLLSAFEVGSCCKLLQQYRRPTRAGTKDLFKRRTHAGITSGTTSGGGATSATQYAMSADIGQAIPKQNIGLEATTYTWDLFNTNTYTDYSNWGA